MIQTVVNAFKSKDMRGRLIFTFLMLIVVRLGTQIPIPGMDSSVFTEWYSQYSSNGAFGFYDALSGGSFSNMSVFALNITPYITASIIMQLLTIAIPKLEEMHKEGAEGRKKITAITRYLTIGLSVGEALALSIGFGRQGLFYEFNFFNVLTAVAVLTAGSAAVMWIGERINEHGVGNGISIVLTINILSRVPSDLNTLFSQFVTSQSEIAFAVLYAAIIIAIIIGVTVLVVVLQGAERDIPVQYSRKVVGNRQVGVNQSSIPLKVNTAGVIPVIFAQSLMQFPVLICTMLGVKSGTGIGGEILSYLTESNWFNTAQWKYTIGAVVYIALIVAFAYFYTSITFNPAEIADNMKKSGGFIPGIRPGKPTVDYLTRLLGYIIFVGAVGLSIVAIIPIFFEGIFNASISFGGTSLIIIVGVIVETVKQIESQLRVRSYKGFLTE